MQRLISALCLMTGLAAGAGLSAGPTAAQPFTPNAAGVTMGHWHLNSRDIDANKRIFVALGGTPVKAGDFEIVRFPGVNVYLNLRPGTPAATGGSVGSVINHVGFLVPNVQDSVAKWKSAGVPVLPGSNGRTDQAFVVTADGLRIEILEDKDQKVPIRHHHVHFFVPETAINDIQAWYGNLFGAKPGMRSNFKTGYVPGAELAFSKTTEPTVTTKGRVLDHIGFDVNNIEEFMKKAEAAGVKPVVGPSKNPSNGVWLAFIADPWGTSIEINQRPNQTYLDQM